MAPATSEELALPSQADDSTVEDDEHSSRGSSYPQRGIESFGNQSRGLGEQTGHFRESVNDQRLNILGLKDNPKKLYKSSF